MSIFHIVNANKELSTMLWYVNLFYLYHCFASLQIEANRL